MREIKFRAWDDLGTMWVGSYVCYHEYDEHQIIVNDDVAPIIIRDTLGQYTGLKDKNGVEVYEGDILFEEEESKRSQIKPRRHSIVVFKNNGWKRDAYNGSLNVFPDINCRTVKVIGNIYENPELLEQQC